jgi:hypothetical protein
VDRTDRLDSSARFRNRLLLYLERRALGVGRWRQQQRRSETDPILARCEPLDQLLYFLHDCLLSGCAKMAFQW